MRNDWLRVPAAVIAHSWLSGSISGVEGFFGGHAWWAEERPVHGVLWAWYALTGAWQFLAVDTIYGANNWLATRDNFLRITE